MKYRLIATVFCVSLFCAAVQAQQAGLPAVAVSDFEKYGLTKCWERTGSLEYIHQDTPAGEMITVVARPGTGDKRPDLSQRRLRNVHAYLTQYLSPGYRRDPKTIGMIEGDRVEGYGRLEFYVGGRLVWLIKAPPDGDVDFGNCYPPDDTFIRRSVYDPCRVKSHRIFYPCRDRYARRRSVRR
ncbi:MAG TPA: hypothetical protein VN256_09415 [Pyrinomonadaceae bacterium]|nr:hypothetical protein [Pyrinomonadaceae bacterium]